MLKKILDLKGAKKLSSKELKSISGGMFDPNCPVQDNDSCFTGPYWCNYSGLPICVPMNHLQ